MVKNWNSYNKKNLKNYKKNNLIFKWFKMN